MNVYTVNWVKSTVNSTWKIHLNSQMIERNWYLRHKATLGSLQYSSKIFIIIWFLFSMMYIIFILLFSKDIHHQQGFKENLVYNPVHITPNIIILLLWFKTPKIYDPFYIANEFGLIAMLFFAFLLIYFSIGFFFIIDLSLHISILFGNILTTLLMFIGVLIQTRWVLKKNNLFLDGNSSSNKTKQNEKSLQDSINNTIQVSVEQNHKNYKNMLCQVLRREFSFENFMIHSSNEYALECLIGYIELTQFQHLLLINYPELKERHQVTQTQLAILSNKCIPNSSIVFNENNKSNKLLLQHHVINNLNDIKHIDKLITFKYRAYLLYIKYINIGNELELNVSYDQKSKISKLFNNLQTLKQVKMTEDDLYLLFDDIIHEQWGLLFSSFKRFIDTQLYKEQTVDLEVIPDT